jgi:hypothetical protein
MVAAKIGTQKIGRTNSSMPPKKFRIAPVFAWVGLWGREERMSQGSPRGRKYRMVVLSTNNPRLSPHWHRTQGFQRPFRFPANPRILILGQPRNRRDGRHGLSPLHPKRARRVPPNARIAIHEFFHEFQDQQIRLGGHGEFPNEKEDVTDSNPNLRLPKSLPFGKKSFFFFSCGLL